MRSIFYVLIILFLSGCGMKTGDLGDLGDTAAQQTITTGPGVYASTWASQINDNLTQLFGKVVSSVGFNAGTITITFADATTKTVNISAVNTDSQTVTNLSLSGNTLSITLSGGNTATVDLSGIVGSGGIADAPSDGTPYVRQDAGWISESVGSGTVPPDGIPVAVDGAWSPTSYTLSTLTLALPQIDLVTVLKDADLEPASLTLPPTSIPGWGFADSDSGDVDQTIALVDADSTTTTAGAVVSDWRVWYKNGSNANGELTLGLWIDGSANMFKVETGLSVSGGISGLVNTVFDSGSNTLTVSDYHGGSVVALDAGVYSLPIPFAGYNGWLEKGVGVTGIIELLPTGSARIIYNGAAGTVGTSFKSDDSLGSKIYYESKNGTDWYVTTWGPWAE